MCLLHVFRILLILSQVSSTDFNVDMIDIHLVIEGSMSISGTRHHARSMQYDPTLHSTLIQSLYVCVFPSLPNSCLISSHFVSLYLYSTNFTISCIHLFLGILVWVLSTLVGRYTTSRFDHVHVLKERMKGVSSYKKVVSLVCNFWCMMNLSPQAFLFLTVSCTSWSACVCSFISLTIFIQTKLRHKRQIREDWRWCCSSQISIEYAHTHRPNILLWFHCVCSLIPLFIRIHTVKYIRVFHSLL